MRFLVGQQLPPALATWLRRRGHDADHTEHLGLGTAADTDIWALAHSLGAIIVTKDNDFAVMQRTVESPQILWRRIGNASRAGLLQYVEDRWDQIVGFLQAGEPIVEI